MALKFLRKTSESTVDLISTKKEIIQNIVMFLQLNHLILWFPKYPHYFSCGKPCDLLFDNFHGICLKLEFNSIYNSSTCRMQLAGTPTHPWIRSLRSFHTFMYIRGHIINLNHVHPTGGVSACETFYVNWRVMFFSPSQIFLSQSVLIDDGSMNIKLAHKMCHAWFGLLIGAKDWTEEWLSEGFATFLEDHVHSLAMNVSMKGPLHTKFHFMFSSYTV